MHEEMDGKECPWLKHKGYRAIRVLTAVIVLIFTFWCGFQFGEVRASVGAFGGHDMVRGGWTGGFDGGYTGQRLMIRSGATAPATAQQAPATTPVTK